MGSALNGTSRRIAGGAGEARWLRACRAGLWIVWTALAGLLALRAYVSLGWRMEHDTPLLHYAAFLMDRYDRVPYRDFFETSMPGTFGFHCLVGRLFGYGDLAFRGVDLALLALLLTLVYAFVSRFGRAAGAWSAVVFGLVYLSRGPAMSLQRDYLGALPIALALLCIPASRKAVGPLRFAAIGLLFGVAALVKPHLAIGLPLVFATLLALRRDSGPGTLGDLLRLGAASGAAFLAPVLVALAWLAWHSALAPFGFLVFRYLPLHVDLTGGFEVLPSDERTLYLLESTLRFGGYGPLLLAGLFGVRRALGATGRPRELALSALCLLGLLLAYAVYPVPAGKFWAYHYMPFAFCASLAAGLCMAATPVPAGRGLAAHAGRALTPAALLVALSLQVNLPDLAVRTLSVPDPDRVVHRPKGGRVDALARWLEARLGPGDTVQPLDWTGGAIHAMLLARAELATRFLYDYHFHHHTWSPVIQELRREFIRELRQAAPRFVIEVEGRPSRRGVRTSRRFEELRRILARDYAPADRGEGYVIYERVERVEREEADGPSAESDAAP